MEINSLFFISVVPAIVLYGIAKSGLGGSISLISVPLMTVVMPLQQALAIILPILIFSDMIAVYRFRKEFNLNILKLIVPFAAVGEKRLALEDFKFIWRKGLRSEVKEAAPSHGLCLIRVGYEEKIFSKEKSFDTFPRFSLPILESFKISKNIID